MFAVILMVITFFDLYAGLLGLLSVLTTNLTGFLLGFDKKIISKGVFGFNSLLVGLGLGIYFQPGHLPVSGHPHGSHPDPAYCGIACRV